MRRATSGTSPTSPGRQAPSPRCREPTMNARSTTLLIATLLLLGCPGKKDETPDSGEVAPECQSRAGCQGGLVCSDDKRCVPCGSSGQCLLPEQWHPDRPAC